MSAVLSSARIRKRIDQALSDAGYTRSGFVPELFGYDPDHLVPGSYSVGIGATVLRTFDGRDELPVPDEGEAETAFVVRTVYRLRADSATDYDEAHDHAQSVLKAALNFDPTYLHATPLGITNEVSDTGEWILFAVTIKVWHRYAFADGV